MSLNNEGHSKDCHFPNYFTKIISLKLVWETLILNSFIKNLSKKQKTKTAESCLTRVDIAHMLNRVVYPFDMEKTAKFP